MAAKSEEQQATVTSASMGVKVANKAAKKVMPRKHSEVKEKLVYIGPNLARLGLSRFQVYVGGIPKAAEKAAEQAPEIKRLFVPLAKLAKAKESLKRSGSLEQRSVNAVMAALIQNRK